jgi:hypothetical protein
MTAPPFTSLVKLALPPQLTKWGDHWLQISGYWMTLSKELGAAGHILVPLDVQELRSAQPDTHIQNSLFIETSKESGSHRLCLSPRPSNCSRQSRRAPAAQGGDVPERTECEYRVSSGFMNLVKERRRLVLTRDKLAVTDAKQFPIASIVSMSPKQGDQACATRLVVAIRGADDVVQLKEFVGVTTTELRDICAAFLLRAKAIAADAPRAP